MHKELIQEAQQRNRPMPEIMHRADIRNSGGWDVAHVPGVRGEPYITVSGRIMRVPLDDSDKAAAIRAHELVHTKISPQDWTPYITAATTEEALRSAEEARVNLVASQLGFPMKALITGTDKTDGTYLAQQSEWRNLVFAVAASVHTGSLRPLISGVRKEDESWADALRDIADEIVRFQKQQQREIKKGMEGVRRTSDSAMLRTYTSTIRQHRYSTGTRQFYTSECLEGMAYTVGLALLLESITETPPPPAKAKKAKGDTNSPSVPEDTSYEGTENDDLLDEDNPFDRDKMQERAQHLLDNNGGRDGGEWTPLKIGRYPLPITVQGALGRKKAPAPIGRNPRRIQRLLTDPQRRIFDKTVKAQGGIVLIDVSGSMGLSKDQVRELMLSAPGCTILAHHHTYQQEYNLHVLADNGKMTGELPKMGGGNGNDLPALEYAISLKPNARTPVVWVTDGIVYKPGGQRLSGEMECARTAKKHGVHMEYTPEGAVDYLQKLKSGAKMRPSLLPRWKADQWGV